MSLKRSRSLVRFNAKDKHLLALFWMPWNDPNFQNWVTIHTRMGGEFKNDDKTGMYFCINCRCGNVSDD